MKQYVRVDAGRMISSSIFVSYMLEHRRSLFQHPRNTRSSGEVLLEVPEQKICIFSVHPDTRTINVA
jgi:hypothetical protein